MRAARAINLLNAAGLSGTAIEMRLQLALAGTMMFTEGPVLAALDALQTALRIANRIGDSDHRLRCLRMIGTYELLGGNPDGGCRSLESFLSTAREEDPSAVPAGENHLAAAFLTLGRFDDALRLLGQVAEGKLQTYDNSDTRFARFLYDRSVDEGNILSHLQWLTGFPDTALRIERATVKLAQGMGHELSLSNALAFASLTLHFCGRYDECSRRAAMLDELIVRHGIVNWRPVATFYRGALACAEDETAIDGITILQSAVADCHAIRHLVRLPYYLSVLAEALAKRGRLTEAKSTIQDAIHRAATQKERWCEPEIIRVQAAIRVFEGRLDEAESLLLRAVLVAQEIRALSWQLRAANDLAKIWRAQSRFNDADAMLRPIYRQFTEGFATRDLETAGARQRFRFGRYHRHGLALRNPLGAVRGRTEEPLDHHEAQPADEALAEDAAIDVQAHLQRAIRDDQRQQQPR